MTISILARVVAKNGQLCASSASASTDTPAPAIADPKPYQPGSITRDCDQENTHGMARRSSIRPDGVRDAGRLPIFNVAISRIGVAARK